MKKIAMIFAAGLGTRLGELTKDKPKALLPLGNKPLLFHIILKLYHSGFTTQIINVHHHAEQIVRFLRTIQLQGLTIRISDESDKLLETGGGLKRASELFKDAKKILLHNVDIVTTLDLCKLWDAQNNNETLATLAVKQRNTSRYFLFDEQGLLKGWRNNNTGEEHVFSDKVLHPSAFSGIHVVSAEILKLMPEQDVFSMTDFYLQLCGKFAISEFTHNEDDWVDVGKVEQIQSAESIIAKSYNFI